MDPATFLTSISAVVVTLLAAAGGGVFGAVVAARAQREVTARGLLADALLVQAKKEAWVLDGHGYETQSLSRHKPDELPLIPAPGGLWLRSVEVRAVLDGAPWCSPDKPKHCFGFIEGRRAWIVRDHLDPNLPDSYEDASPGGAHPAILSSQGFEELAAWIEQVASARSAWTMWGIPMGRQLSDAGLEMLKPLLKALATDDRIKVFQTGSSKRGAEHRGEGGRLTKRAVEFLREWQRKLDESD